VSSGSRARAGRLGLAGIEIFFCVALPLIALSWAFRNAVAGGDVTDFELAFYPAAEALRGGASPYPGVDDPAVAAGVAYVYPPLTAMLAIPLTVFPAGTAGVVAMALLVAAVFATLWALDVRDWRCFGLALAWPGVYGAIMSGTLSIPLALVAALVWRYRDRARVAGTTLGLGVAMKLILWPLALWLAATRRLIAAVLSALVALVAVTASWAVIGFAGLEEYPDLLRRIQELEESSGYTVFSLALDLGASEPIARSAGLVLGALLLVAAIVLARRGAEQRSFVLAVAAALACSPIVWLHYFALLLVPVAVARPRLDVVWFVPLGMWWFGAGTGNGTTAEAAVVLAVAVLTVVLAYRASPGPGDPAGRSYELARRRTTAITSSS
jgi:alpha-1,2-mannosyltransferase